MKNDTLYEILEVSENASKEVIEKAYKTLAKKYHPDLQKDEYSKNNAEKNMKKINEAYEILSNTDKRKEYDNELKQKRQIQENEEIEKQKEQIYNEINNRINKNIYNNFNNNYVSNEHSNNNNYNKGEYSNLKEEKEELKRQKDEYKKTQKMQEEINREYENAYEDYLRSLGYRVKHKWTKQNYKDFFITLLIMAVIIFILSLIPPVRNWFIQIYEQNPIIKGIVNVFIGILRGIWNAITGLFK